MLFIHPMTVRYISLLAVAHLLWMLPLSAQTTERSFLFEGQKRTYRLFLPKDYTGGKPVPLVLNLHGYGSNALEQELYTGFYSVADTAHFIVVHPNGLRDATGRQYWNTFEMPSQNANDLGFLNALLDSLQARYNIDPQRIYSTGMSNGGFMSYDLACNMSHRIAAIASVTGSMLNARLTTCKPPRPVPVMEVHGTADPTVPYNGSTLLLGFAPIENVVNHWVRHNKCVVTPLIMPIPDINKTDGCTAERWLYTGGQAGSTVEFFRIINGGHTWPGGVVDIGVTNRDFNATQEVWRFFRQYRLSPSVGTEEAASDLPTAIYPNPCSEQVQLTTAMDARVQIFDLQGRLIWQQALQAETPVQVNAAHWPVGVYAVHTLYKSRTVTTLLIKH